MEDALAWMKAVQQRLQINDNTQGPRAALEARLRETEVCRDHGLDSPVAFAVPLSSGFRPGFRLPNCEMARWTRPQASQL